MVLTTSTSPAPRPFLMHPNIPLPPTTMKTIRSHRQKTSSERRIRDLIESYRTTLSGRRVAWDEPGEEGPEVIRHNEYLSRRSKQKKDSQDRLKSKGKVPSRNGEPLFEQDHESTSGSLLQLFMMFQTSYQSDRKLTFSEWSREVALMLDILV